MTLYPQIIIDALATVTYAGTKKNLIDSEMVADTPVVSAPSSPGEPWKVKVVLEFPRDTDPFLKSTVKSAEAAIKYHCKKLAEESGDTEFSNDVEVEIATEFKSAPRPEVGQMLPGVKNIIAVSSGKGGVGKSTVSANLAIALARLGYKVGLLDTDIFGPSMPKMFDVEDERPYAVKKDGRDLICPIEKYGVKLLSIGFFVSPTTATLSISSSTPLQAPAISTLPCCRRCPSQEPSSCLLPSRWHLPMRARVSTCTVMRRSMCLSSD